MAPEAKNNGDAFKDREKPVQVRASNITAAKGKFWFFLGFVIINNINWEQWASELNKS